MSARRALLVVVLAGHSGAGFVETGTGAGRGWVGRPAVVVRFLVWGRAGAPVVGLLARPGGAGSDWR